MWKHTFSSVRGSSHLINGLPCQDFSRILALKDTNLVLCALSDGAGSAKCSDQGAQFLVDEVIRWFSKQLSDHPNPSDLLMEYERSDVESFLTEAQSGLQSLASAQRLPLREFSATLLFAAIHPVCSLFFQIGDGYWIAVRQGSFGVISWPARGEFVGQTDFVTSPNAVEAFRLEIVDEPLKSVVGITDGLERLALDLVNQTPHAGFFSPLLAALAKTQSIEVFEQQLSGFLASERVCERTDDDKSMVLVTRNGNPLR